MRGAGTRWADGDAEREGNRARGANLEPTNERRLVSTLELALEEPVELLVLRCLLAVRDGDGVWL